MAVWLDPAVAPGLSTKPYGDANTPPWLKPGGVLFWRYGRLGVTSRGLVTSDNEGLPSCHSSCPVRDWAARLMTGRRYQ